MNELKAQRAYYMFPQESRPFPSAWDALCGAIPAALWDQLTSRQLYEILKFGHGQFMAGRGQEEKDAREFLGGPWWKVAEEDDAGDEPLAPVGADNIRAARLGAGLTQEGMADAIGVPRRTVQSWEAGVRQPPTWAARLVIEKLQALARGELE